MSSSTPPAAAEAEGVAPEPGGFTASKIAPRIKRQPGAVPTISLFESGEHTYIGNSATLRFPGADGHVRNVDAQTHYLVLPNDLELTYGNILALGGDFYGIPNQPISDGANDQERDARFQAAFDTLAVGEDATVEVPQILAVINEEVNAVDLARRRGDQPSVAYAELGDSLSKRWNQITGGGAHWVPFGRYLKLAGTNWDHFGPHALAAYQAGHRVALHTASEAGRSDDTIKREKGLAMAYAMNAFADHFMTDLFSSGHMRTPRKALHIDTILPLSKYPAGYLSRYMHDEDCMWGLYVRNRRGDTWIAYGDKKYANSYDTINAGLVGQAVQASIDEVFAAFNAPDECPENPDDYAALQIAPDLDAFRDPDYPGNFAACFVVDDDPRRPIRARKHYARLNEYAWTRKWMVLTSAGKMEGLNHRTAPPTRFLAAPQDAPTIQQWTSSKPDPPVWQDGTRVRYAISYFNLFQPETESWGQALNESDMGPWSEWATLEGGYEPTLDIPVDMPAQGDSVVEGRRIYLQVEGRFPQLVGDVDNNTAAQYTDRDNNYNDDDGGNQ